MRAHRGAAEPVCRAGVCVYGGFGGVGVRFVKDGWGKGEGRGSVGNRGRRGGETRRLSRRDWMGWNTDEEDWGLRIESGWTRMMDE